MSFVLRKNICSNVVNIAVIDLGRVVLSLVVAFAKKMYKFFWN